MTLAQVVGRADDTEATVCDGVPGKFAVRQQFGNRVTKVFFANGVDGDSVDIVRPVGEEHSVDRRLNGVSNRPNVDGQQGRIRLARVNGGTNSPAIIVSKNEDEAHSEGTDRVFEGSDYGLRDCLPRVSDDKKVTQSEVENDFGRQPGIRATEKRRERSLSVSECIPVIDVLPRMCERATDETTVTGNELLPRFTRRSGSLLWHRQPFPVT